MITFEIALDDFTNMHNSCLCLLIGLSGLRASKLLFLWSIVLHCAAVVYDNILLPLLKKVLVLGTVYLIVNIIVNTHGRHLRDHFLWLNFLVNDCDIGVGFFHLVCLLVDKNVIVTRFSSKLSFWNF